jgi:hypothetical protein
MYNPAPPNPPFSGGSIACSRHCKENCVFPDDASPHTYPAIHPPSGHMISAINLRKKSTKYTHLQDAYPSWDPALKDTIDNGTADAQLGVIGSLCYEFPE